MQLAAAPGSDTDLKTFNVALEEAGVVVALERRKAAAAG